MTQPTSNYRMVWSWPYQMVAPVLFIWGAAFPFLIRYVEWRPIEESDWWMSGVLISAGIFVAACLRTTVDLSNVGVTRATAFGKREIRWADVDHVDIRDQRVVLIDRNGKKLRVELGMTNSSAFARDIDSRFTSAGVPQTP